MAIPSRVRRISALSVRIATRSSGFGRDSRLSRLSMDGASAVIRPTAFVFVGLSRKSVAKRMVGTPVASLDPAGIPMALILTVASKAAERKFRPVSKEVADKYQLTPELAEALQNSKTIRFVDVKTVNFPWYGYLSGYRVNVEMVDGSKETLLPSQTYTKKDIVKDVLKRVLGDKVSG